MPDRRFEDKLPISDLMKKDTKELLVMIYMQVAQTNGTVQRHCDDIEKLQIEMREKIGWKIFTAISAVLAVIIILFNVLNIIAGA
jgi:hypothetical protein